MSKGPFFDFCADCYKRIKLWVATRPIQLLAYLVGALVIIAVYTAIITTSNRADISDVKAAFCNSDGLGGQGQKAMKAQELKCQHLFSKLLQHPTPEQARRLKQIVKEAP